MDQDGTRASEILFRTAADSEFDYLVFEVLGDKFEVLGRAVGKDPK